MISTMHEFHERRRYLVRKKRSDSCAWMIKQIWSRILYQVVLLISTIQIEAPSCWSDGRHYRNHATLCRVKYNPESNSAPTWE